MRLSDGSSGSTNFDKKHTSGSGGPNVVMSTWTKWENGSEYQYTKYMEPNGTTHTSRIWLHGSNSSNSGNKSNSSNSGNKSNSSSSSKKKTTPAKAKPKPIPKKPAPPKAVAKPSFKESKPVPPSAFSFNVAKPTKREALVPQPPTPPGPMPTFQTKKEVSTTRFEYMYGIKDLQIKHNQYQNKSVYVSTPIKVDGNVMQVSLHSIEEHPLFDALSGAATDRQTSIEYYIAPISTNPAPALDEWMPILPEDTTAVKSELVIFGSGTTADLRFPALIGSKETPVMYKNGIAINEDDWSFADGGYKVQLLVSKDQLGIYTIDYTPNAQFYNPWLLDIHMKGSIATKTSQSFPDGTNHNKTISLDKYPYVNYEVINTTNGYDPNSSKYLPVKVTLANAGIIGSNRTSFTQVLPYDGTGKQLVYTKNTTNYKTGIREDLKPYSIEPGKAYNAFEYHQVGNQLFFSETFNKADIYTNEEVSHGNATIVVDYEYLSSQFRVKIILRRNSTDENTLTPIVHEYALKFKVMK